MNKIEKLLNKVNSSNLDKDEKYELLELCFKICMTYFKTNKAEICDRAFTDEIIFKVLQLLFTETENNKTYILTVLKNKKGNDTSFGTTFESLKKLLFKSLERELKN